jgi:hypothetical protein
MLGFNCMREMGKREGGGEREGEMGGGGRKGERYHKMSANVYTSEKL